MFAAKRRKLIKSQEINIGFDLWKLIFAFLEWNVKSILLLCQVRKEWTFPKLSSLCMISWSPQHAMQIKTYSQFKCISRCWSSTYKSVDNDLLLSSCQHFKRLKIKNARCIDLSACSSCSNLQLINCSPTAIPKNVKVLICSLWTDIKTNILGSMLETLVLYHVPTQENLMVIAGLPRLCNLAIGNWDLQDFMLDMSVLSRCTTLQRLRLPVYYNFEISMLTQLIYLDIHSDYSQKLSNLSNLSTLVLRVSGNKLIELAEYDVCNVKEIILVGAPLFYETLNAKITCMEDLKYRSQYRNFQYFNTTS